MKHILLSILLMATAMIHTQAQESAQTFVFEGNNFKWHQTTNGSLFYSPEEGLPGLEVPIGQQNNTIFASTLWAGGITEDNDIRISYRRFCSENEGNCFENWGPLKLDGTLAASGEIQDYNYIWFVTKEDINLNNAYFDCLEDPNCNEGIEYPNYEIPADFLTWPAQSAEGSGFDEYLAPFVDRNGDGSYSASDGDYPAICGDFSSYFIWNGTGTGLNDTPGSTLKAEFHTTVYGFDLEDDAVFNTLFVKHKMIYRGEGELSDCYVGFWTDFDIGNFQDDYVQSDVERSMFYGFNSDGFDDGSSLGPGYGEDVPAMGAKVLGGPFKDANGMDDSSEYASYYANETSGFDDGITDNERLGLYSSFFYYNSEDPSATQAPQNQSEHYNFMRAIWRDGSPFSFGGIGYNPSDVNAVLARYGFPGISDPLFAGTNGIDPNYPSEGGWTEENEGIAGSDRRMIGSSGPFTFAPGDVQYIDLAYIFARESFDEEETVIETLQRFADEVEGMQCEPLPAIALSADSELERKPLQVYPNPSEGVFSLGFESPNATLEVIDITGKTVEKMNLTGRTLSIDLGHLPEGIYLVQVQTSDAVYHGKLVLK